MASDSQSLKPSDPEVSVKEGEGQKSKGIHLTTFQSLLNKTLSTSPHETVLSHPSIPQSKDSPSYTLATYPDSIYLTYPDLGISFIYYPVKSGYRIKSGLQRLEHVEGDKVHLTQIDLYNNPKRKDEKDSKGRRDKTEGFPTFPGLPIQIPFRPPPSASSSTADIPRPDTPDTLPELALDSSTTGMKIVQTMGEPDRKGGTGGGGGEIGTWVEYTDIGIMLDFRVRGWDLEDVEWRIASLFEPGMGVGGSEG